MLYLFMRFKPNERFFPWTRTVYKHTLCALQRPVSVLTGPLVQHWTIICLGRWSLGYSFNKLDGRMWCVSHQPFEMIMYMLLNHLGVLLEKIDKFSTLHKESNATCGGRRRLWSGFLFAIGVCSAGPRLGARQEREGAVVTQPPSSSFLTLSQS